MQLTADAAFDAATFSSRARSCRAQEDLKEDRTVYYTLHKPIINLTDSLPAY